MLNSHPHIAAPPECGFLQWWHTKYGDWSGEDRRDAEKIEAFARDVLQSKKMETWDLTEDVLIDALEAARPESYGDACSVVYQVWHHQAEYQRGEAETVPLKAIVDKNNYYVNHLEAIDSVWPEARYIFLTRDGLDVAASYKGLQEIETDSPYAPDLPTSIPEIATEWVANNERVIAFLRSKPSTRWVRVRYEDVIRSPEKHLRELMHLLEVPYQKRVESYYTHNDEPEATLDWKRRTLQPPDPSRIGRYQEALTAEEITAFKETAEPMLDQLGYLAPSQGD